jgi:diguanylate cyclase (GGDEF)-like protein/putative nucleotidyltransferase with HDIG domain
MQKFGDLKTGARVYVGVVVGVGFAAAIHSILVLLQTPVEPEWLALAALTLLTGSFTIKVPSITARISVSEPFVFASVLLFGAAAGTLTVVLEALVISLWVRGQARTLYRAVFNVAAPAISIWLASTLFFRLSGIPPFTVMPTGLTRLFAPLAAMTALYFLSNSGLVAVALGLEKNRSPFDIWWNNFTWLSINYFSGASVAALIVTYSRRIDLGTLVVIVPLLVISYLTFRTAMGRVEDSNHHLVELNRLYLSTIETLAMAVDAKDQVTHGHIRRVQAHATSLARAIGVKDDNLLRAIEAAALLHDMGKLAVPEYILNKPGKLTPAEFDKMKVHASVGADILSAIDFPYPVVPIVRHHHENWDGSGYPAGLRHTDIPIGARILSVVDCFDALTSDRPYRPKLSDDEALEILIQRRGIMYDPLVVDTFVRVHASLPKDIPRSGPASEVLKTIADSRSASSEQPMRILDEVSSSSDEMLTLYELARALGGQVSIGDAADVIAKHLRRLIPYSLGVFYTYDDERDELEATQAVGDSGSLVIGMRIPLGQRLSGWVAANRRTICNSDPTLDLGDVVRTATTKLRSCVSTPLLYEDQLVGVTSLYSTQSDAFTDDHRRILELVGRQIAVTLKLSRDFERLSRHDTLTGLPSFRQLEQFIDATGAERFVNSSFTLILIDVVNLKSVNATYGRDTGDEVLRHVARQTRGALRSSDILFRYGGDEFVAVLHDAEDPVTASVVQTIRERVERNDFTSEARQGVAIAVDVTSVASPSDGLSLRDLMTAARIKVTEKAPGSHAASVH